MPFEDDVAAAVAIVDKLKHRVLALSRERNLSLKMPSNPRLHKEDWVTVLGLDGNEPEFRVGFSVHLSQAFSQPGCLRIWSLVTDLKTDANLQFCRENVPLSEAAALIEEGLGVFEKHLKSQDGLDPIAEKCRRMGTAFYWRRGGSDGVPEWETDFPNGWSGLIVGDRGYEDLYLQDEVGNDLWESRGGDTISEMAQLIEAEYARRTAKAE